MKTTDDPKTHTIRVRINDEMHRYLIDRCGQKGTISDYVRDMIVADMSISKSAKK